MSSQPPTLADAFNLDHMSELEQQAFLEKLGDLALEAALGRLLLELDEAALATLETYLANVTEADDVLGYLQEHHPTFEQILTEEVEALRQEGTAVAS